MLVSLQSRTFISFWRFAVTVCARRILPFAFLPITPSTRAHIKARADCFKAPAHEGNRITLLYARFESVYWSWCAEEPEDGEWESQRVVIINANDCYGNSGTSDAFAPGQKTETEQGAGSWESGAPTKARVSCRRSGKKQDHNGSPKLNTQQKFKANKKLDKEKSFLVRFQFANLFLLICGISSFGRTLTATL